MMTPSFGLTKISLTITTSKGHTESTYTVLPSVHVKYLIFTDIKKTNPDCLCISIPLFDLSVRPTQTKWFVCIVQAFVNDHTPYTVRDTISGF